MEFNYIRIDGESTEDKYGFFKLFFDANENQLLHFYEPDLGLFAVESPMVIERALMGGYRPVAFVMIDSLADEMCARFAELAEEYYITSNNKHSEESSIDKTRDNKHSEESSIVKTRDNKHSKESSIPVYIADYETIAGLTGVNITRGVLALMKRQEMPDIKELLRDCHRIAVFDDVENPTNVGAMFRSAAALGIEAVVLTGSSSDPLYRRASRVSVGTVFQIPWIKLRKNKKSSDKVMGESDKVIVPSDKAMGESDKVIVPSDKAMGESDKVTDRSDKMMGEEASNSVMLNNPDDGISCYIDILHALGFKTAAMALSDNSVSIRDERLKSEEKLAIILGNEGFGLSVEVIEASDYVVKIPMKNNVDSLNVAAASSVVFWELAN